MGQVLAWLDWYPGASLYDVATNSLVDPFGRTNFVELDTWSLRVLHLRVLTTECDWKDLVTNRVLSLRQVFRVVLLIAAWHAPTRKNRGVGSHTKKLF